MKATRRNNQGLNNQEYRFLADLIPLLVWSLLPDGSNDYVNRRFLEYTGLSLEQVKAFGWVQIIHPEDRPLALAQWNQSVKTGEPYQMEYRLKGKDDTYRWHTGRNEPMRNRKSQIVRWFTTATDIDEQKQTQEAWRSSQEQLHQKVEELETKARELEFLADSIPHIVWRASPDGTVVFYNQRWFEFTGISPQDGAAGAWRGVPHPEDLAPTLKAWETSVQTGAEYRLEHRINTSDGTYRWLRSHALPLTDALGNIVMWFGTATDIHEQKLIQHQLEHTLKELEQKNFELDQFVYKTSHDLRAPLSTILGLVSILKQETNETTKAYYVDLIEDRVWKLDKFIRSMLDYSRNARTAASLQLVDFREVIQECLQELEHMKHFTRLSLSLQIQEGEFYSDRFRLKIIFSNLISNAVKYQDFAKSESQLLIRVAVTDLQASIDFADNGVGIDQAYQQKIFDMFFRAAEQSDGSGLGLYIVKQAVGVLKGSIQLDSIFGIGTRFTISLPKRMEAI